MVLLNNVMRVCVVGIGRQSGSTCVFLQSFVKEFGLAHLVITIRYNVRGGLLLVMRSARWLGLVGLRLIGVKHYLIIACD